MAENSPSTMPKGKKKSTFPLKELVIATAFLLLGIFGTLIWQQYFPSHKEASGIVPIDPPDTGAIAASAAPASSVTDTAWTTPPVGTMPDKPTDSTTFAPPTTASSSAVSNQSTSVKYYVLVGVFKTPQGANARKHELSQGGYASKLLPPDAENPSYRLTVGPYQKQKTAVQQAKSIRFILDINTSVLEIPE